MSTKQNGRLHTCVVAINLVLIGSIFVGFGLASILAAAGVFLTTTTVIAFIVHMTNEVLGAIERK